MNLSIFKQQKENIEEIETDMRDPVSIQDIEDMIKLINVASEIKCDFKLVLNLEIGEFCVKSDNFKGIKMSKATKKQADRLVISHSNALLLVDTVIQVKHIVGITFALKFEDRSDVNV